jgi:hypothetical protein
MPSRRPDPMREYDVISDEDRCQICIGKTQAMVLLTVDSVTAVNNGGVLNSTISA